MNPNLKSSFISSSVGMEEVRRELQQWVSRVICKAQWMLDVLQTFKRGLYIVFPCMFALVSINPPIFYFPSKIGSGSFFKKARTFLNVFHWTLEVIFWFTLQVRGKKIFKWLHYTASILKSFLLTFFCYHTLKALAFCLNWNLIVFHVNKCVIISLYLWLRFCSFAANKEAKKKN